MKETAGLEFKFGIKYKDEKKQKISIYELGKNNHFTANRRWSNLIAHVESTTQLDQPTQLLSGHSAGSFVAGKRDRIIIVLDCNSGRNNLAGA